MNWRNISLLDDINPLYKTKLGASYVGDSIELLSKLPNSCIDLVMTSPPFALRRQKDYGNVAEHEYVDWIKPFAKEVFRVLKDTGSFVLDLGGSYRYRIPSRSLYNFRVLISLCDDVGFHLAEDFYWHNPSKLPSPIEWVNKRKIRAKDSIDTVWWFSKTEWPKADVKKVLVPYSERMKKLIENPDKFYKPKKRPSGHDIGSKFGKDNKGAIPSNLLSIPNSNSNSDYLRRCKELGFKRHPARYPEKLPKFFVEMLTDPNDLIIDIFAGSNTTGHVAENLGRRWLAFDSNHEYLLTSTFRFLGKMEKDTVKQITESLNDPNANFDISNYIHK